MRRHRPSLTARRVAAQRARLSRPCGPDGDPDAEQRLYQGIQSALLLPGLDSGRMAVRTRWFDDETVGAIGRGVTQIVIVGAGYDGRALRFRAPGVRWIEVDHPATQHDKRRRLATVGVPLDDVMFVALDLIGDDLDEGLARAGHHAGAPTLFVCEGLLGYLPPEAVASLLRSVRGRSCSGSVLAVNFRVTIPPSGPGQRARRVLVDGILATAGEARRSEFGPDDPDRLLASTGWQPVRRAVSDRTRIDGGSEGLLVAAVPA
jgi:methyltransferase (TIGR00027 family)